MKSDVIAIDADRSDPWACARRSTCPHTACTSNKSQPTESRQSSSWLSTRNWDTWALRRLWAMTETALTRILSNTLRRRAVVRTNDAWAPALTKAIPEIEYTLR
jgi:hypothetical protein